MRRFTASLLCDLRIQVRAGFYYAAGFVALLSAAILTQVPDRYLQPVLGPVVFGNLMMNSFYFIGGLVLLEKREGTLQALVVTPLRRGEYLLSKLATLAALAVGENLLIVLVAYDRGFDLGPFLLGALLASAGYSLAGFAFVVRYESINEYLFPSVVVAFALSVPYLWAFDLWQSALLWLHPLQGAMVLLQAAFVPVTAAERSAALGSSLLWIALLAWVCRAAFYRFVVREVRS